MISASMKQGQKGFTLVEIAIVLLVVTILLGYTVALFPVQQELKQYRQANNEVNGAIEHLIAFAQINGRLPCPDTSAGASSIDGREDRNGVNDCHAYFGFLPGRTLGILGDYDDNGVLLDPWGQGYRYAVSPVDTSVDGDFDLVTANGVRNEGVAAVVPNLDLFICDDSATLGTHADCTAAASNEVMRSITAVIISQGKDRGTVASNIQAENVDDFHDGTNDKVYIFASQSDKAGSEFDDVVKWLSSNLLFSRMIAAEQLP